MAKKRGSSPAPWIEPVVEEPAAAEETKAPEPAVAPADESLKVHVDLNGVQVYFKIKRTTRMQKVFSALATRQGVDVTSLRVTFRGARVGGLDTADIVGLANRRKMDVREVAKIYFAVGTRFRLGRLRAAASNLESDDHWQQLAVAALVEEVYAHQLALASNALDHLSKGKKDTDKAITAWVTRNQAAVDQTEVLLNELWTTEVNDLSMVAVASRQLRALADAQA